jgi:hypothetical protein
MIERTVAIVEVVPPDWVNNDPQHLIEYTPENPAAIGWAVVDGVVQVPPPPPLPDNE